MSVLVHAALVFGVSTACSREAAVITPPGVATTGESAASVSATVPSAVSSGGLSSNAVPSSAVTASAVIAAPPGTSVPTPVSSPAIEDPELPAGCLPVSPKDTFWDYPDEHKRMLLQHPGARSEPMWPGAYRARIHWDPISSQGGAATQADSSGCLRVDVRTVNAEYWSTRDPSSLVVRATVEADAPWELTSPARFAILHPKLDTIYSFGVRAVCHAKPAVCQAQPVTLWIEHPFPGRKPFALPVKLAR